MNVYHSPISQPSASIDPIPAMTTILAQVGCTAATTSSPMPALRKNQFTKWLRSSHHTSVS